MSDTAPPPLPFYPDAESIEKAAEQLIHHGAQIEQIRQLTGMVASRQDVLNERVHKLDLNFQRVIASQTVIAGALSVLVRRQRRQMLKDGSLVEDPDDVKLEEALLGRLR